MKSVLLSFKALGDFVIAHGAYRQHQKNAVPLNQLQFCAGHHLRDLAKAIGATDVQFLHDHGDSDVPAVFDIKKKGIQRAVQTAWNLRQQLSNYPASTALIFDRLGWRERFIGGHHPLQALPAAENIYLAYEKFFKTSTEDNREIITEKPSKCLIIPSSRIETKIIPEKLIINIENLLAANNIQCEVLVLDGENLRLPTGISKNKIPKNFDALVQTIRTYSFIISADSLPAHIAEYFQIPIFVFTPTANTYWLPRTSFNDCAWSDFTSTANLKKYLINRF